MTIDVPRNDTGAHSPKIWIHIDFPLPLESSIKKGNICLMYIKKDHFRVLPWVVGCVNRNPPLPPCMCLAFRMLCSFEIYMSGKKSRLVEWEDGGGENWGSSIFEKFCIYFIKKETQKTHGASRSSVSLEPDSILSCG